MSRRGFVIGAAGLAAIGAVRWATAGTESSELEVPGLVRPAELPPLVTLPTGRGFTEYQKLRPGARISERLAGLASGQLTFEPGTFADADFSDPANFPVYSIFAPVNRTGFGIRGSGMDRTVFSIEPNSSTWATRIPEQAAGGTNQLHIMRVTGAAVLSDFSVRGTQQPVDPNTGLPHNYNGLQLFRGERTRVRNIKVSAIPGNNSANPGETFSINDYKGTGNSYVAVEVDGRDAAGQRRSGSGIGLNRIDGATFLGGSSHDLGYGSGISFSRSTGVVTLTEWTSNGNVLPFNLEQNLLDITFTRCDFSGNRARTPDGRRPVHLVADSDSMGGSSRITIVDPIFDGPTLTICIHPTYPYPGPANLQLSSDVRLIRNGVERPDLVSFVDNWK